MLLYRHGADKVVRTSAMHWGAALSGLLFEAAKSGFSRCTLLVIFPIVMGVNLRCDGKTYTVPHCLDLPCVGNIILIGAEVSVSN